MLLNVVCKYLLIPEITIAYTWYCIQLDQIDICTFKMKDIFISGNI